MSYPYRAITYERYAGIVPADSPLAGRDVFADFDAACRAANDDPYLPLAWLCSENDFATDISDGLLAAKNAAGIKDVGQRRALPYSRDASGRLVATNGVVVPLAPASEGRAPYCVFATWADFFLTLAENIAWVLAQRGGDLNRAAWFYTLGTDGDARADAGEIHAKARYYDEYTKGDARVPDTAIYGSDIIARAREYIGQVDSDGFDGNTPRNHPWAYWCEAFGEAVPRSLGLDVPRRNSAAKKGYAYDAQGLLRKDGDPEHGAHVIFGPSFYFPDGHIGFWDKEKGSLLGTLTDGRGIGYDGRGWGPNTYGYMGWARIPGVAGEYHPAADPPAPVPPAPETYVPDDNPLNAGRPYDNRLGYGGAIKDFVLTIPPDVRWKVLGFPVTNEYDGYLCTPKGGGLFAVVPCVVQDTQRQRIVFEGGIARIPLRDEVCGPADDPAVDAILKNRKAQAA